MDYTDYPLKMGYINQEFRKFLMQNKWEIGNFVGSVK